MLKLRAQFQKFDDASDSDKKKIIDDIKDNYIHPYFGHNKPADLKRKEKKVIKKYNKLDHTFVEKNNVCTAKDFIKEFISSNRITEFHPVFYNEISYDKIEHHQFNSFMSHLQNYA